MPYDIRIKISKFYHNYREAKIAKSIEQVKPWVEKPIKKIGILGLFSSPSGLGRASQLLIEELSYNQIETQIIDCYKILNDKDVNQYEVEKIKEVDAIIIAINPDIAIHIIDKIKFDLFLNKKIIGYWVWELPDPPPSWVYMNHLIHEIWTPSNFSKNSLCKIFSVPIKVVSHPAALIKLPNSLFDSKENIRKKYNIEENSFVAFQSFSFQSCLERKNIIDAIEVFKGAFKTEKNAYFIIRYSGQNIFPKALSRLKNEAKNYKEKIILLESNDDENQLFELYKASDIYISLHRSEGFGLNIAEAMLAGLPTMVTNWSGNLDFTDSNCSILIDSELIKVVDPDKIYSDSYWAQPNKEQAIAKLIEFKNNIELRLKLKENGRKQIINLLGAKKLFPNQSEPNKSLV